MSTAQLSNVYDSAFYSGQRNGAYDSARKVYDLIWPAYQPRSVVDVGCGTGSWLKAATEFGVDDYLGLEGPWLTAELAAIPFERIQHRNLQEPFTLDRKFDLAISMEVAEHLPASSALGFIQSLTRSAPVVLFSAASFKQRGTNHLNEQWTPYWARLFEQCGYTAIDALRRKLWDDPAVDWWYAQNAVIYVKKTFLAEQPALQAWKENSDTPGDTLPLALIHPARILAEPPLPVLCSELWGAFRTAVRRRIGTPTS